MLGPQKRKPFNSGQIFIGIWTIFIILHLDLSQVEYMKKIFEVRVGAMKICNSLSLPTLHALHRNMAPCWPSGEIRKTRLTSHIYVMSLAIARCFTNFLSTGRSPLYYTGSLTSNFCGPYPNYINLQFHHIVSTILLAIHQSLTYLLEHVAKVTLIHSFMKGGH